MDIMKLNILKMKNYISVMCTLNMYNVYKLYLNKTRKIFKNKDYMDGKTG